VTGFTAPFAPLGPSKRTEALESLVSERRMPLVLTGLEDVQRRGSAVCSEASALGLAGAGRLGARLEAVGALARAGAGDLCERGARLVVGNVGLARVGEEGQDDGDALGRGRLAGRDGDEESAEESGTGSTHVGDKRAYSIRWSLTGREG
jgi:hypothetical protein